MQESTDGTQWRDSSGHIQAVIVTAELRVTETYQALIRHPQGCEECRRTGVDCAEAAQLRTQWREAKSAALAADAS